MATYQVDGLSDLERHRLRLEENVAKLRQSLRHWQTWDAEYEGLKEEIQGFEGEPTPEDLFAIGRDFGGDLVNEKEIRELLGTAKGVRRTGKQVVDIVARRMDYVQQNVRTVQKQLDTAEERLESVVNVDNELRTEDGLPLSEIREELDEEGNVISSSVSNPAESAPKLVDALRKAGITDVDSPPATSRSTQPQNRSASSNSATTETQQLLPESDLKANSPLPSNQTKKAVAFAEDTKVTDGPSRQPTPTKESSKLEQAASNLSKFTFNRGHRAIEINDDYEVVASIPVIPNNETPEEAALRRQMLQYGLSEVGAVVAEIDLEEGDSEMSEFDDEDFDEEESDDDDLSLDSAEENEYGLSTRSQIDSGMRQRMLELEQKLNARMFENVGPEPELESQETLAKDVRRLVIQKEPAESPKKEDIDTQQTSPKKKGVKFAEELDISPAPTQQKIDTLSSKKEAPAQPAFVDTVLERGATKEPQPSEPAALRKPSRFKSSRAGAPPVAQQAMAMKPVDYSTIHPQLASMFGGISESQMKTAPEGPSGQTLSEAIKERPPSEKSATLANLDDLDPNLLQQELATEYYKARNRMIQKQGGFKATEEDDEDPLMEERDGQLKKVSRFKAARLRMEQP